MNKNDATPTIVIRNDSLHTMLLEKKSPLKMPLLEKECVSHIPYSGEVADFIYYILISDLILIGRIVLSTFVPHLRKCNYSIR